MDALRIQFYRAIGIIIICFVFLELGKSQVSIRCGNSFLSEYLAKYNSEEFQSIQDAFQICKQKNSFRSGVVYRIPVVFHVVYKNENQNIHDSCIQRQIEILNECFGARNQDRDAIRSIFGIQAEDAMIEFYLADKDPLGNSSSGIVRRSTTKTFSSSILTGALNIDMKDNAKGGSSPWDVKKYMNVWVVNMPIVFLGMEQVAVIGFATPPANLPNWPSQALQGTGADGIVMQYQFIGDNNPQHKLLGPEFELADRGRALVHETGHYLGLRHIWADKGNVLFGTPSCVNSTGEREDDGIDDTPYCGNSSQLDGCDDSKNTCTDNQDDKPDMWENFMDYSEEKCQILFTGEQITFMRSVLENFRPQLINQSLNFKEEPNTEKEPYLARTISNNGHTIEIANLAHYKYLNIYDIQGKPIMHHLHKNEKTMSLHLENFHSGIVVIQLIKSNGVGISLKCFLNQKVE